MSEINFPKGVSLKSVTTKFGEIIKVGINIEKFNENPQKNGWVNFDIKRSKENNVYPALDTYNGGQ